jgi:hypothetical protein
MAEITFTDDELEQLKGEDGEDGETPDLSAYALKTDIPAPQDLSPYALKTDIPEPPDLASYATHEYVDEQIAAIPPAGGGTGGRWGVDYRSFGKDTDTDDTKLTAALAHAKAQTYIPNVLVPPGFHRWTKSQGAAFSGLKLVGPNEGGPMNPEQGAKLVNHIVNCSALDGPLFYNSGTVFDVFVKGLCFQGGPKAQFWRSTGNLYACTFDNLTFYGFKSVFGNATEKALMTYTKMIGCWQVIGGGTNMQFHPGGSDNDFWVAGDCNIGPTDSPTDGDFQFWFDGVGKTNVGSLYCTAGGMKGIRVSGHSSGSPVNFTGLRLEGKPGGKPATTLLQVDSGEVTFVQAWFAYAAKMIVKPAAHVDLVACRFNGAAITAS